MQLSMVTLWILIGVGLKDPLLIEVALIGYVSSAGIAKWSKDADLEEPLPMDWTIYRKDSRTWDRGETRAPKGIQEHFSSPHSLINTAG